MFGEGEMKVLDVRWAAGAETEVGWEQDDRIFGSLGGAFKLFIEQGV